jgi:hypothetical protein
MKPYALIIYCLILSLVSNSFAADPKPKEKDKNAQKVYGDVVVSEDLQKLLTVPGVQAIFDTCKTKDLKKISECIWEDARMTPEKKKQVQAIYAKEIESKTIDSKGRSIASTDKTNLTGRSKTVGVDYASDPAVAALSEYYGKKLDEIMAPTKADLTAGKIVTVDHTKFIELYKSELGKTIINAFTSYCLETDPKTCCVEDTKECKQTCKIDKEEKNRKDHKTENLRSLSTANMDIKGNDSLKWNKCIKDVSEVCFKTDAVTTNTDISYSAERACVIVDYVKAARKNIMIVDDQAEFYKDYQKNNQGLTLLRGEDVKIVEGEAASADAILEMTSKDVAETLKASTAAQEKEMEACIDPVTKMIADINSCKKFLNTNKDDNVAAVTEFGLRQLAQEDTLKEQLDSGDDKVKAYLKEEGFAPEKINELSNKENIEETKTQILARYKAEKKAIIAEMASRIDGKTVSVDGKVTNSDDDKDKLQAIQTQLSSRGTDLANLVKFNNIVTSYLNIEDNEGKQSRNTASLFAESKTLQGEDAKIFKENIDKAKLTDKKNSSNLNIDTINDAFLDYDKKQP